MLEKDKTVSLKPEQQSAIMHDDGNLLVSASAGSGKTFVMIERLIRLVQEGKAKLDQILAVTFTEAAALDMKEKLKKALRKSISKGDTNLASVVTEVETADISTIHAFCGRLIRKYFFVVGVSPDFVIADENQANLIKQESLNKTFRDYYKRGDKKFLELVDKFSNNRLDQGFRDLILSTFDFFSAEANPRESAFATLVNYQEDNFSFLVEKYKGYFNERLGLIKEQVEYVFDGLNRLGYEVGVAFCRGLIEDIEKIQGMNAYEVAQNADLSRRLTFERNLCEDGKRLKDTLIEARKRIKKIIEEYSKHLTTEENDRRILTEAREDTQKICEVLGEFSTNYLNEKTEENLLDFSDLEHFALKVLQDKEVCDGVKEKYKYVFIDEYQDVNGVQEEIISKITSDNLFMVGDVKQSIYGFRGCRADFFANKLQSMPQQGQKTLQLNYNFRSANLILKRVNDIFTYTMTEQKFGIDYTKSLLVSGGIYPPEAIGRAEIHLIPKTKKQREEVRRDRIYDILEQLKEDNEEEAEKIASLVASIINQEINKTYYDTKSKEYKRITFGDIAILTRNKDNAYVAGIVNGLIKHGVPVVSEISQDICQSPEIQTLINLLKLVDCFNGDIPLASVLKSAIGKFSEEDLAEIVLFYTQNFKPTEQKPRLGSFYDAYVYYLENATTNLKARLKDFNDYVNELRFLADFIGAKGVLEKVVLDTDYVAENLADRGGSLRAKRIRKFIKESEVSNKRLTIQEFLSLIENNKKAFDLAEVAEEDTVKILTMHASKGLEFPVVIVCGLERNIHQENSKNPCYYDREYGFAIKSFDTKTRTSGETLLRGIIKEKQRVDGLKEELRLLYVALTRPTYSLHMTLQCDDFSNPGVFIDAKNFKDCIPPNLPKTLHEEDEFNFIRREKEVKSVIFGSPDSEIKDRIKSNFEYVYPYSEDVQTPLKTAVTKELAQLDQDNLIHYLFQEDSTDVERGIIAHKLLENIDFSRQVIVKNQAESLVKRGVLTEQEVGKINLERIQKAFDSGAFDGLDGRTLYREKPFICAVDAKFLRPTSSNEKIVIQGIIDLLAVNEKDAIIIDYKYSSLVPESLKLKYQKQLEIYAKAFTETTKIPVSKKILVNVYSGDVVEI